MPKNLLKKLERHNYWTEAPRELGYIRQEYIEHLSELLGSKLIKVLIGQRRVGKSYVLKQFINLLIQEKSVAPENILYINFELADLRELKQRDNFLAVLKLYIENLRSKSQVYLLIDEIQELETWEEILASLLVDKNIQVEIFVTGSNSTLLSSELASYIGGRYITKHIYPFSYQEFRGFQGLENNKNAFMQFIQFSQLPEMFFLKRREMQRSYMQNIKDSILLKDIVARHNIQNVDLLEKLFFFLVDNIGNLFSLNSIVRKLENEGVKTNTSTIGNYVKYIEDTFIINGVDRYDIKGKRILEGQKKYYLNDLGFRNFLFSDFDLGLSQLLENYTYNTLKQAGYEIHVGNVGSLEIDFIASKEQRTIYFQVAYLLIDEEVVKREYGNLEKINNHWEKYVISLDEIPLNPKEGIRHVKAWELAELVNPQGCD